MITFAFDGVTVGAENRSVVPIEDTIGDIIGKAQRGLGFTGVALAEKAGVSVAQLRTLRSGKFNEEHLRKVSKALDLGVDQMVALGKGEWYPRQPGPIAGFEMFTTPFGDMTVNAYLAWDPESKRAVVFDSGADAKPILDAVKREELTVDLVLITHAHRDHVVDLPRLISGTKAKAWINSREGDEEDFPEGVETFATGQSFVLGKLRIETLLTSGHSAGQTTYVIKGLEKPIAVVGDSLFAGSIGGGLVSFKDQLRNDREQIMTLPGETVIASGHGPLTTVAEEKLHNPFFCS